MKGLCLFLLIKSLQGTVMLLSEKQTRNKKLKLNLCVFPFFNIKSLIRLVTLNLPHLILRLFFLKLVCCLVWLVLVSKWHQYTEITLTGRQTDCPDKTSRERDRTQLPHVVSHIINSQQHTGARRDQEKR